MRAVIVSKKITVCLTRFTFHEIRLTHINYMFNLLFFLNRVLNRLFHDFARDGFQSNLSIVPKVIPITCQDYVVRPPNLWNFLGFPRFFPKSYLARSFKNPGITDLKKMYLLFNLNMLFQILFCHRWQFFSVHHLG